MSKIYLPPLPPPQVSLFFRVGRHGKAKYLKKRSSFFGAITNLLVKLARQHSNGQHITLAQTEKWLRQADVIDNWNLTTTDTAISYRKISRQENIYNYKCIRSFTISLSIRLSQSFWQTQKFILDSQFKT